MFKRLLKKIAVAAMVPTLVLGLVGCGSEEGVTSVYTVEEASTTKVLSVGDYDIYMDEVALYAIQILMTYSYTPSTMTDDDTIDTDKGYVISLIRENKIIYNVAINNDVELDDDDMEVVESGFDNIKTKVGDELLAAYGISDELIEQVLIEQATISKFENDIENEMGQTILEDVEEEYEDVLFTDYYYMLFPTVEVEDGDPKTDDDGEYVYVSDEEKEEVKAQAEEALERVRNGESYEDIAEEYGVTDYSREGQGYTDSYGDQMNDIMNALQDGECTDVFEDTLGYAFVYMINSDDEDLKDTFIDYYVDDTTSTEYDTLYDTWLATIEIDDEKDFEGTVWEDFDLYLLSENMVKAGVLTEAE